MPVEIKETSATLRTLEVTIPQEDLKAPFEKKLSQYKKQVTLKGFRQGQVPKAMILKQFGDSIHHEVVNEMVDKVLNEELKKAGIIPVGQLKVTKFNDDKESAVTLTVEVEMDPEIDIKGYADTGITVPQTAVHEEEVQAEFDHLMKMWSKDEHVDRAAQKGDVVVDGGVFTVLPGVDDRRVARKRESGDGVGYHCRTEVEVCRVVDIGPDVEDVVQVGVAFRGCAGEDEHGVDAGSVGDGEAEEVPGKLVLDDGVVDCAVGLLSDDDGEDDEGVAVVEVEGGVAIDGGALDGDGEQIGTDVEGVVVAADGVDENGACEGVGAGPPGHAGDEAQGVGAWGEGDHEGVGVGDRRQAVDKELPLACGLVDERVGGVFCDDAAVGHQTQAEVTAHGVDSVDGKSRYGVLRYGGRCGDEGVAVGACRGADESETAVEAVARGGGEVACGGHDVARLPVGIPLVGESVGGGIVAGVEAVDGLDLPLVASEGEIGIAEVSTLRAVVGCQADGDDLAVGSREVGSDGGPVFPEDTA